MQLISDWHRSRLAVAWLGFTDSLLRRRVTGDCPVVVSLTTHGERLKTVHSSIQSIVAGTVRPSRLILWLDGDPAQPLTPQLQRLRARGLEIRFDRHFGPHKKYYSYVRQFADAGLALVTADDDVLYARDWLVGLVQAHRVRPDLVNCYMARRVATGAGGLAPYRDWRYADSSEPSPRNFALGVGGVIYPPRFVEVLRDAGEAFRRHCPKADDIWLHAMALRHGFSVRQIAPQPVFPLGVPFTQEQALFLTNQLAGGNDAQITATYSGDDLRRLEEAGERVQQAMA